MTFALGSPTILPLVLLCLCLSGAAAAAPDDCRDGMLRLHVANIVNGTGGNFGELAEDDISYVRDLREGCLVWLSVEGDLWVARITEADFAGWHACEVKLRWENPALSSPDTWPSPSQFLVQGDAAFALVLLEYVELSRCSIYAVMMLDGSIGIVLPPRTQSGESHWAKPSAALRVPQTFDLPRSGEHLAPLLQLAFEESGIAPLAIGPRGGVFEVSGQFIARFTDGGGTGSVRREVCQPDPSALGAPDLTDAEIAHLTGGDLTNREIFFSRLVGSQNSPIDIRAVALNC